MVKKQTIIISVLIVAIFIVCPALAEEMTSTNYKITIDSINIGGEDFVSSTNYRISDTLGEVGTGVSTTTDYKVKAGYRQMELGAYLSLSVPSDITMSPNIQQRSGGESDGSGQATVITDGSSGYVLSIRASAAPAITGAGSSFADYTPAAAGTPDFTWSIAAGSSEFGFSPEGTHIVQKFQDNGAACNAGALDTADSCWYNLSTANESIAQSFSANHPAGTATTVKFKAESSSSNVQTAGAYSATITLTALSN